MRTGLGIAALACSVALVLGVSVPGRHRLPSAVTHALVALAGAGLGIGALLPQQGVRTAEWIVAPLVLAALLPVHIRLLFAGNGPLRV
jgi:hypothetical protein